MSFSCACFFFFPVDYHYKAMPLHFNSFLVILTVTWSGKAEVGLLVFVWRTHVSVGCVCTWFWCWSYELTEPRGPICYFLNIYIGNLSLDYFLRGVGAKCLLNQFLNVLFTCLWADVPNFLNLGKLCYLTKWKWKNWPEYCRFGLNSWIRLDRKKQQLCVVLFYWWNYLLL